MIQPRIRAFLWVKFGLDDLLRVKDLTVLIISIAILTSCSPRSTGMTKPLDSAKDPASPLAAPRSHIWEGGARSGGGDGDDDDGDDDDKVPIGLLSEVLFSKCIHFSTVLLKKPLLA